MDPARRRLLVHRAGPMAQRLRSAVAVGRRRARRFDIFPAWPAFAGAAPALSYLASLDLDAVRAHGVGLADRLRAAVGLPAQGSPIVALGFKDTVERLAEAGVVAGARAGRARLGFHIYNTEADVERVVNALS